MQHRRLKITVVAVVALIAAACGADDDGGAATGADNERSVDVEMVDIAFEPETLTVKKGETVRFRFTSSGKVAHDAFIGDTDAQKDHEEEMREGSGAHHGSKAEDAITVDPGETGTLTYTFDESGEIEIGCHQPGHYEAGMKIDVTVE